MRRSYRVGATSFGVRTTSERFGVWLDETFPTYARRRNEWPEYSVVLDGAGESGTTHARQRFHVLYRGIGPLVRTTDLRVVGRALLAEFESRLLDSRTDAIFTHASLMAFEGVHVLGPSWLPAYLGRLGRRVERAEVSLPLAAWVAIDPSDGRVIEVPSRLEVPGRPLDGLSANGGRSLSLWPATGVKVDAVITYVEGLPGLEAASRGGALYRLAGFTANLPAMRGRALEGLGRLVAGARTFEVGLGRAQQMLDAVVAVARHELAHRG